MANNAEIDSIPNIIEYNPGLIYGKIKIHKQGNSL